MRAVVELRGGGLCYWGARNGPIDRQGYGLGGLVVPWAHIDSKAPAVRSARPLTFQEAPVGGLHFCRMRAAPTGCAGMGSGAFDRARGGAKS